MTDQTEKLDAFIGQQEQALKVAVAASMREMNQSPVIANIRAYEAARKALDAYLERQATAESGERFKNIEQAAAWIAGAGYLVSVRTVRNHAERTGFPRKQKDGSYLKSEIEAYAATNWENPTRTASPGQENGGDHKTRYLKEQADKLELANEITRKNYILRTDVEQRCAQAAAFLKKDLSNFGPRICDQMVSALADFLRAQGMDMENINLQAVFPDLLYDYDQKLDAWLDRYARSTRFTEEEE